MRNLTSSASRGPSGGRFVAHDSLGLMDAAREGIARPLPAKTTPAAAPNSCRRVSARGDKTSQTLLFESVLSTVPLS